MSPTSQTFLARLHYVLRDHRRQVAAMVALFFAISFIDLVGVGLVGPFMAAVMNESRLMTYPLVAHWAAAIGVRSASTLLVLFALVLIVVYIVKGVAAYRVQHRIFAFSFSFRASLIERLTQAYLSMPYQFHLERNSATLVQSVLENTKVMAYDLLIPTLRMVSDTIVVAIILVFLCWASPLGMLLAVAMLGGAFLVYAAIVRPLVRAAGEDSAVANARIIKGVNQAVWNIKEIRTLGVEQEFSNRVSEAAESSARAYTRFYSLLAAPRFMMESVVVVFVVVLSLAVLTLTKDSTSLVPTLAMFAAAGLRILPAVTQISGSVAGISYSTYSLAEVCNDLGFVEAIHGEHTGSAANVARPPCGTIAFDAVSFVYPGTAEPALSDISFTIRSGESIGLIGESGAGKTTLVDMLLGFHVPTAGTIRIDGVDIADYGWRNWRRQIAYIPQNLSLIDDTLEANITFGMKVSNNDDAKVLRVVKLAQLTDLVERLPLGLKTVIGERGVRLSGGERQRIALARGFFFDRDIFILDEATSALDDETERQIVEVLKALRHKKTFIVIAHRYSTIEGCDVVYRLSKGRIVGSGSYPEVVKTTVPVA